MVKVYSGVGGCDADVGSTIDGEVQPGVVVSVTDVSHFEDDKGTPWC